ncbi:MAG: RAMP superfamily CRISPR-associated protein [Microcoleaceae cyanobacterium]
MKFNPEQVPMMYRAQVDGRCSLQYGNAKEDLKEWTKEWVTPDENNEYQPFYQQKEPLLGLDGSVFRIKIKFPFRVFTNCGQDSILRPTIGKNGIPFIPGSSIKGLFKQLQNTGVVKKETIDKYCGSADEPGILRFHGAYPVGDWAGTRIVELNNGDEETRYGMVDVVHPQQERQVQHKGTPQAIATISFDRPTLIFELSSVKLLPEDEWKKIGGWLKQALKPGLGGKTSTGYGLYSSPKDKYPLWVELKGKGVSPLLRSGEPEFRPNLFKATLRGHVSRLLAGVSEDRRAIENKIDKLFGCTTNPGNLQLYWQSKSEYPKHYTFGNEETPVYEIKGELSLDAPEKEQAFLQKVLEFTFVMAGLGKSWRRVWHGDFFHKYKTRAIGCHWEWLDSYVERTKIQSSDDLKKFLTELHEQTKQYMGVSPKSELFMPWYEAWSPKRLSIFSQEVSQSKAIKLFHNDQFKTTPAIGGRKLGENRPTSFSLVWHRMLPIDGNKYLEIVTLFHGKESDWQRENSNMLPLFVNQLEKICGLQQTWGDISLPIE